MGVAEKEDVRKNGDEIDNGKVFVVDCKIDKNNKVKVNKKLMKLYEFYVLHSPCKKASFRGKPIDEYGWENPWQSPTNLKKQIINLSDNKDLFCSFDGYNDCENAMKRANLLDWEIGNGKPKEIICIKDCQKNQVLSCFYHIRNSLAHGRFEIKKISKVCYYFMEDVCKSNKRSMLSARMILKENTLVKWIDLIINKHN